MQAPAAGTSSARLASPPLTHGPALAMIMQRPGFAQAFRAMAGAAALPAWVKPADDMQPSARIQMDGKAMWLSHACKVADCQGDQLLLLTEPAQHAMQGLLVEASGGAGASVRPVHMAWPAGRGRAGLFERSVGAGLIPRTQWTCATGHADGTVAGCDNAPSGRAYSRVSSDVT